MRAFERIPRTVRGLAAVSLFNDFASEMVYPLLPAFVTTVLGAGAVTLSALDGAADLTAAVLKWASGWLSDRPGWRKPLILAGYGTAVLIRPLIALANSAGQVIGFRVLDRVGKGLRTPPRDALIADSAPPELHGRAFGFHRGADHLGAVAGSVAAWWFLSRHAEVRQVIEWSAVPGVVVLVALAVVLRGSDGAGKAADPPPVAAAPDPGRAYWAPVLTLAVFALARLPETLLLLRLQQVGVALPLIPLAWAGLHMVRSGASYPGGRLNDHLGPSAGILVGAAIYGATLYALAIAASPLASMGAFLALGLAAGATESAERTLVARLSPRRQGRGFGGYHAVTGFAALPAALLFGTAYAHAAATALTLSAALTVLSAVLWVVVGRRVPVPTR